MIHIDGEDILVCPNCRNNFLKQYKTEIFDRDEDDVKGLHIITEREKELLTIKSDLKGNPSMRRDGLKIHFKCEMCPVKSVLEIYQHKGQTFIEFKVK